MIAIDMFAAELTGAFKEHNEFNELKTAFKQRFQIMGPSK